MNIYYLGPDGSYSELIVQKVFKQIGKTIPKERFEDVVSAVQQDAHGIGVLAIENSITSSVHSTVDLMYDQSVVIVGEASMKIELDLLGAHGSSITSIQQVYSHPQALAQCSQFIHAHHLESHEMNSTSKAAQFISNTEDRSKGAIGGAVLARKHKLVILKKDIANMKNNMTRWVFISRPGLKPFGKRIDKLTYIFKVQHEPGSLVKILKKIADMKGNLTKIESRPLPGSQWEYGFWIDVEVPEGTHVAFDDMMKRNTLECRLVGAYERGKLY